MVERLTAVVVVLLAATAVYKLSSLRRGPLASQVALAGVFVCLAVGVVPFTGWPADVLGDSSAVNGWANALARVFVIAAAGLAQVYLLLLADTFDRVRGQALRRLVAAGSVAVGIVVLAVLTPEGAFGTAALDVWPEATTHLLFLAYLAIALAGVAHASLRWARACSGVVRLGLRLVAAGSMLGIVYATGKVVATVLELAGARPAALTITSQLAALVGLALVAAGSALPGIDRLWRAAQHGVVVRRRLDVLYPLWSDLIDVTPGIALEPVTPRWRDRLHVRDLDMRLYRRVIEIRDGQLALARRDVITPQAGRAADLRIALALPSEQRDRPTTVEDEVTWWSEVALSYEQLRQADARATRR